MADSEALRARRARRHRAGDHSLCRRCAAVRSLPEKGGYSAGGLPVSELPPPPASMCAQASVDPLAELRLLAARLAAAYRDAPDNAMLARELRLTLQALMPQGGGTTDGELEDLFAKLGGS